MPTGAVEVCPCRSLRMQRWKSELSLIQCDTNFNVIETSRVLQLKLLRSSAIFVVLANCTDVNGRDFIKREAENVQCGIGNHFPYNPISDNMPLSSMQRAMGLQRRCFINPIEIQSKDLTIRQKVFECTNVPAKSEKTHSNQDPRPNHPTLRPFQSLNTKVIKWILLRNSVRNKSNCTFTSQWLWIVSIVDWISQGNYNLICWIWCPFCPFQNASGL